MDLRAILQEARQGLNEEVSLPICYVELEGSETLHRYDSTTDPDLGTQVGRFFILGRELGQQHREAGILRLALKKATENDEGLRPLLPDSAIPSSNAVIVETWMEPEQQGIICILERQQDTKESDEPPTPHETTRPSVELDGFRAGYGTRVIPDKEFLFHLEKTIAPQVLRRLKSSFN